MVRDQRYKYIRHEKGEEELYDLDVDKSEKNNLVNEDSETLNKLRKTMDEWRSKVSDNSFEAVEYNIDDATRKNLESLGYM